MAPDLLPSSSTHRSRLRRTTELAGALSYDYPPSSQHSNTVTIAASNDAYQHHIADKKFAKRRASRTVSGVDVPASPSSSAGSSSTSHTHQHPTRQHTTLVSARDAVSPYQRPLNSKSKRLSPAKRRQQASYESPPTATLLPAWNVSAITSTTSPISLLGLTDSSPSSAELPTFSRPYSPSGDSSTAPEPAFGSPLSQSELGYPLFDETVQSAFGDHPYSPNYGNTQARGEAVGTLHSPENVDEAEDRGASPAPFDNAIDGKEFAWLDEDGNRGGIKPQSRFVASEEKRKDELGGGYSVNHSIRNPRRRQASPQLPSPYKVLRALSPGDSVVPQAPSGTSTHTVTAVRTCPPFSFSSYR